MNWFIRAWGSLFLLLVLSPRGALAQVQRNIAAFQLVDIQEHGEELRYSYRLLGHASRGEVLSDVYLDIDAPKKTNRPVIYGSSGAFLVDGIELQYDRLSYGHPPLYVGTPAAWSGAVYMQGVLSWGATRYAGGPNYGLRQGQELRGFELRSPALPAFRRYQVVPYRRFPSDVSVERGIEQDTTWVILTGVVLAPGWEKDQVVGTYLQEQINLACEARLVGNCGRYLRLSDAIIAAEERRHDRSFQAAVRSAIRYVSNDEASKQSARFVISRILNALAARPPSKR